MAGSGLTQGPGTVPADIGRGEVSINVSATGSNFVVVELFRQCVHGRFREPVLLVGRKGFQSFDSHECLAPNGLGARASNETRRAA